MVDNEHDELRHETGVLTGDGSDDYGAMIT